MAMIAIAAAATATVTIVEEVLQLQQRAELAVGQDPQLVQRCQVEPNEVVGSEVKDLGIEPTVVGCSAIEICLLVDDGDAKQSWPILLEQDARARRGHWTGSSREVA